MIFTIVQGKLLQWSENVSPAMEPGGSISRKVANSQHCLNVDRKVEVEFCSKPHSWQTITRVTRSYHVTTALCHVMVSPAHSKQTRHNAMYQCYSKSDRPLYL